MDSGQWIVDSGTANFATPEPKVGDLVEPRGDVVSLRTEGREPEAMSTLALK